MKEGKFAVRLVVLGLVLSVTSGCGDGTDVGPEDGFTPNSNNDPDCPDTEDEMREEAVIPSGANCGYANLVTDGDVSIGEGANVELENAEVRGNVQTGAGSSVSLRSSVALGDVQIEGGPDAEVFDSRIEGNLQIVGVTQSVSVVGTDVLGDLQISECRGQSIEVRLTSVQGNLDCTENTASIELEEVEVVGSATGQCSGA